MEIKTVKFVKSCSAIDNCPPLKYQEFAVV
jgi:hypothetical protein